MRLYTTVIAGHRAPPSGPAAGPLPSRASPAVSTLSFPPVPSVVVDGGWRPSTPRSSASGRVNCHCHGRRGGDSGRPPSRVLPPPSRRGSRGLARPRRPPVGCGPHRPHPAPPTHKDSRCLSCCSCCASCRRLFCSRRRCSSCSGGSRGRRDPAPDDIATRGGLTRWKVTSSTPQRNPTDVPPARAAERPQGTRSQAPAALRPMSASSNSMEQSILK